MLFNVVASKDDLELMKGDGAVIVNAVFKNDFNQVKSLLSKIDVNSRVINKIIIFIY
jgi:hypothetical protein